jgi:FkbM family methyltransferase
MKLKSSQNSTKKVLKFLISNSEWMFKFPLIQTIAYKIADVLVNQVSDQNGFFEIFGFKMKKGRTTRYAILTGESEPITTKLISESVKDGMVVFDLGANIGIFTVLLSKLVGKNGQVYAFEPDPELNEILKQNVENNNLQNVFVYSYAISDQSKKSKFSINHKQDGDNRLNSSTMTQDMVDVETITLDEFCKKNNILPDFLKMDIQGSEPKAIRGMKNTLRNCSKIKIISEFYPDAIIDVGDSPNEFLEMLNKLGFTIKMIDEKSKRIIPIEKEKFLKMKNEWPNLYCYK